MSGGNAIQAKLVFYTSYEYVVQPGEETPAILMPKHTVDYVGRKT
jgi:hypothetical protein